MNSGTPWLDDVARHVQIGLLLRRLKAEYSASRAGDPATGADRRPRSPLDDALASFSESRSVVKQIVEAVGASNQPWPAQNLPAAEQLAGLRDRVRFRIVDLIGRSGSKAGGDPRRVVENYLRKAVEQNDSKDYREISEDRRRQYEDFLVRLAPGLDQQEGDLGIVKVWIELARGVRAWKQFRRHLDTGLDSVIAKRVRQEVALLMEDEGYFGKWREEWMNRGENGTAPRSVLASVTRFFAQYSEATVSSAFDYAANVCERTRKLLVDLSSLSAAACDESRAESVRILSRAVDASLTEPPAGIAWPPVALAAFFDEIPDRIPLPADSWTVLAGTKNDDKFLNKITETLPNSPPGVGEEFWARALLLCKVVSWADRLQLSMTDWELLAPPLRNFAQSLFPRTEVEVSLFASRDGAPPGAQAVDVLAEAGERSRVKRTGLALRTAGDAWRTLRKAEFARVRPTPEIVRRLEEFMRWCEGRSWDDSFFRICDEIREEVRDCESLKDWWEQLNEAGTADGPPRERLWRLMERLQTAAAAAPDSPAVELLSYLHKVERLFWEESDAPLGETEIQEVVARGGVVLTTLPVDEASGSPRPATYRVRRLRLPDGRPTYPHVLLQAPPSWLTGRPLAARLALLEPLRLRTQFAAPDWDGWEEWNKLVVDEVYDCGDARRGAAASRGLKAFRSAYLRGKENDAASPGFRTLARELHGCLTTELGVELRPALDSNLTPLPVRVADADTIDIEWRIDSKQERRPTGTVLDVAAFGDRVEKARVAASLDHRFPANLLPWLSLPIPAATEEAPESFVAGVRRLPWAGDAAAAFNGLVANLRDWLATPDGEAWLTKEIEAAVQPGKNDSAAWTPWLKLLLDQRRLEVFPLVDLDTGKVSWPESAEVGAPGVRWEADDAVARRELIRDAYFSTDRRRAHGVFSQGPEDDQSPFAALVRLAQDAAALPPGNLRTALVAVQQAASGPAGPGAASESALIAALDAFVAMDPAEAESTEGGPFASLRDYCRRAGYQVLPQNWMPNVATPPAPDDVPTDATQFSDRAACGTVIVISPGLRRTDGEIVRAARTRVSAGTAPAGYGQLLELLAACKLPATDALLAAARKWPDRKLKNVLEKGDANPLQFTIARDFFPTLYKSFDEAARQRNAEAFTELSRLTKQMLKEELGLTSFEPKSLDEFPKEWMRFVNQTKQLNPRIRRVVCPGLCQGKQLFISAEVELE